MFWHNSKTNKNSDAEFVHKKGGTSVCCDTFWEKDAADVIDRSIDMSQCWGWVGAWEGGGGVTGCGVAEKQSDMVQAIWPIYQPLL